MMRGPMLRVDNSATLRAMARISERQFPFAFARGLTTLAKMGRLAAQRRTRAEFDLKTEFIPQGITIQAARKSELRTRARTNAYVLTKPRISTFMPAHEFSALKTPGAYSGASDKGRMLAIPGRDLRKQAYQTRSGKVKKRYRISELLKWYNQLNPREAARAQGQRSRFNPRTPFLLRSSSSGQLLVVRRRSAKRGARYPLEILYVLVPEARIPARWRFHPAVQEVVRANYVRVMRYSMLQALRTAR